jgi:DUF2917 family protein
MDTDRYRMATLIGHRATLRIPHGKGRTVVCVSGRVWITQHGEARDVFLSTGESLTLDRGGEALVQAIGTTAAVIMLDAPAAAPSVANDRARAPTLAEAIDRFAAARPRAPHWRDPGHPARISLEQLERDARELRALTLAHIGARAAAALRQRWQNLRARLFSRVAGRTALLSQH